MVETEFIVETWDQFYDFTKERPIAYKFLEVTDTLSFYAYMIGSERIAFVYKATSDKDFEMKKELLSKQGFITGYKRAVK